MEPLRRHAGFFAILCLGGAYLWFAQGAGAGQNAHYALVRALAERTAVIDRILAEGGNAATHDIVRFEGHYYSNKAPGLAFATLPTYVALERAGVRTTGDPTRMLWALGLVGTVLPATLLLLLVGRLAERLEPGYGTATAVALGAGTLLLPYGTVFLAHALSAFLVFAAFAVLWREREGVPRAWQVAGAGALAGLAVTTEFPTALVAPVLGAYALAYVPRLRLGLAYAVGVFAGIAPLLAYNWWAFGSPTRLSYGAADVLEVGGTPGAGELRFFGVGLPSLRVAVEILFSNWGLFQVAPILAAGVFGTVVLLRGGSRAEGLVIASIVVLFIAYNSAFWGPVGGGTAGTRYLIPMIPFLALPVAVGFRAMPVATAALAVASATLMVAMTATHPLSAWDGEVLRRLASSDGSATTVSDFLGVTGWYDIVPFYVLVLAAIAFAVLATRVRPVRADVFGALAALAAWGVVAVAVPRLLADPGLGRVEATAAVVVLVAVVVAGAIAVLRSGWRPILG